MVTLLNKGDRTYDLHDGVEKDGKVVRRQIGPDGKYPKDEKVVKRKLAPGHSIDALDDDEATLMLGYSREIVDASKVVPQFGDKVKVLEAKVEALTKELEESRAIVAKYEQADKADTEDEAKKAAKKK